MPAMILAFGLGNVTGMFGLALLLVALYVHGGSEDD